MNPTLAFVSPTGNVSGAEVVLLNLMEEAGARGAHVRCLCPRGDLVARLPEAVEWVEIPEQALGEGPRPLAAARLGWAARAAAATIRRAAQSSASVVVNGFLALPAVRLASPAAPVTWIVHDVLRRRDWFAVLRFVRGGIDRAVAVSDAAAAPLRALGLPVVVVPNGVKWPVPPRPTDPVDPVVGCVAALTPWKGHESLLEAFALVKPREARLELAGEPFPKDRAYAASLRARASRPDLTGRVTFLGRVNTAEVMRTWTLGVSASVEPEATPLVVLEAMSIGLPMVATALGGSLELLGHAGGFLVPPADPPQLARAIEALLDDAEQRSRLAAWGRREIAAHYRLDRQIASLLDAVAGGPW
ncbi:MAG: glycosyltransferase family 4 protein [Candidatus Nanopelagicales bacterium]